MSRNLMTQFKVSRDRLRAPLQGACDAEDRERQTAPLEGAQDAPQSGARAVFEQRFHAHVAHRKCARIDDLREKGLRGRVAVEHAVLGAFLMIEDELQGDACRIRPARMWRMPAVALKVAAIGHGRAPNTERKFTPVSLPCSRMRS